MSAVRAGRKCISPDFALASRSHFRSPVWELLRNGGIPRICSPCQWDGSAIPPVLRLRPEFERNASAESLILRLRPNPEPLWSRIETTMALDHARPQALDGRRRKNTAVHSALGIRWGEDFGASYPAPYNPLTESVDEMTAPQSSFAGQLALQIWTHSARGLPSRLPARTLSANSSAACFTATVPQGEPTIYSTIADAGH
ncbi:hypothetical protein BMYO_0490 [Bifidobacterium myosotis]|uniref:Uncharacterized protein n=1 Tax=Bifidobacterium myosotis TaxID=1630166 RepID=A0A261FPS7_9BIFI|nr:hypothetical protein BMYO_0490 [Bifidobacterium myosotis]